MKQTQIFLLLIVAISAIFLGCPGKDCNDEGYIEYNFQLPFSVSPQQDTFQVGDTIWVIADFSDEVLDLNSGNTFLLEDFSFNSELNNAKIDTTPFLSSGWFDDLLFFGEVGKLTRHAFSTGGIANFFEYEYTDHKYKVKIGIVPIQPGLFLLAFHSHIPDERLINFNLVSGCKDERYKINYFMNEGNENHFEMLQHSQDSIIRSYTLDHFNMAGGYVFAVVE